MFSKIGKITAFLKKYKFESVYYKLLMVFSFILIISILFVGISFYFSASQVIKNQVNKGNIQELTKLSLDIDSRVDKVQTTTLNISNYYMLERDYNELTTDEKLFMAAGSFMPFKVEDFIDSVYIYYFKSNKVVSSKGGVFDFQTMIDKNWFEQYKKNELEGVTGFYIGARSIDTHINTTDAITAMIGFPATDAEKRGIIVVNINKQKMFDSLYKQFDSHFMLYYRDTLLAGSEALFSQLRGNQELNMAKDIYKSIKLNDGNVIVSKVTSGLTGWSLVQVLDEKTVASQSTAIKLLVTCLIIFSFLGGLFCWLLISSRIFSPVTKLANKILEYGNTRKSNVNVIGKNEIDLLHEIVDDMVHRKQNVEISYNSGTEEIILKILNGEITDEDKEYILSELGKSGACNFGISLFNIEDYNTMPEDKLAEIKKELKETLEASDSYNFKVISAYIQNNTLLSLAIINGTERLLLNFYDEVLDGVKEKHAAAVTVAVGNLYSNFSNLYSSYQEALNALNYRVFKSKGSIISINDIGLTAKDYYYPISKEVELIDAVKTGGVETALKLIREIYNSIPKSLSMVSYVSEILWRQVSNIFYVDNTYGNYDESERLAFFESYRKYKELGNADEMLVYAEEKIIDFIRYKKERKNSKNEKLAEFILNYIEKNFDKDLTINDIASAVYISPAYASALFKDSTGRTIGEYLREIRVEKAKIMLAETNKNIEKISASVGYNQLRSFLRVFKSVTGMTPSEYRMTIVDKSME